MIKNRKEWQLSDISFPHFLKNGKIYFCVFFLGTTTSQCRFAKSWLNGNKQDTQDTVQIINGTLASESLFHSIAKLSIPVVDHEEQNAVTMCTGVLISDPTKIRSKTGPQSSSCHLLTAKHCFDNALPNSKIDISFRNATGEMISKYTSHAVHFLGKAPEPLSLDTLSTDLAIVAFDCPETRSIKPINLSKQEILKGTTTFHLGFGKKDQKLNTGSSLTLQMAKGKSSFLSDHIPVQSNFSSPGLLTTLDNQSHICTGDSGGPLLVFSKTATKNSLAGKENLELDSASFEVAGVASFIFDPNGGDLSTCDAPFAFYAPILENLDWINETAGLKNAELKNAELKNKSESEQIKDEKASNSNPTNSMVAEQAAEAEQGQKCLGNFIIPISNSVIKHFPKQNSESGSDIKFCNVSKATTKRLCVTLNRTFNEKTSHVETILLEDVKECEGFSKGKNIYFFGPHFTQSF